MSLTVCRLSMIVALTATTYGCDETGLSFFTADESEQTISETPGTVQAVEKCVQNNEMKVVSIEAVRNRCAVANELGQSLDLWVDSVGHIDWSAGKFSGKVSNKSSSYIITGFRFRIVKAVNKLEDESNPKRVEYFQSLWVEPGQEISIEVPVLGSSFDTPVPSCSSSGRQADCWFFESDEVKGLLFYVQYPN